MTHTPDNAVAARGSAHTVPAVRRLLLRARLAVALRYGAGAALATAFFYVVAAISARLFGVYALLPAGTVLIGLTLVALVAGIWSVRRAPIRPEAAAAILDRRQHLGGLLLTRATGPGLDAAWQRELEARMRQQAGSNLPRIAPTGALLRIAGAIALALCTAFLPVPESAEGMIGTTLAQAVERTAEEVEVAVEERAVDPDRGEELARRAEALEQRLRDGDPVAWNDVDNLQEQLRQEQSARVAALRAMAERATSIGERLANPQDSESAAGARDGASSPPASSGSDRELAELAARAAELGLMSEIPANVLEAMLASAAAAVQQSGVPPGLQVPGGLAPTLQNLADLDSLDLENLDAEELAELMKALAADLEFDAELAERLAESCGSCSLEELQRLAELARLTESDKEALKKLVASRKSARPGEPKPGRCEGEHCDGNCSGGACRGGLAAALRRGPGRGGVSRGPGDADLNFTGATDADLGDLSPHKLAPGQRPPDRSIPIGITRGEPTVAPRVAGPGTQPQPTTA